MHSNLNSLRHHSTTLGASLGCPSWIYGHYCPTGTLSLVGQEHNQHIPRSIRDALAELLLLKHTFDVKIFVSNEVILINKFLGSLVAEVFSFVLDSLVNNSRGMLVALILLFRKSSLYLSKSFLFLFEKARLVYLRAVRALYVGEKPQIKSDYLACLWKRFRWRHFTGKIDVPFTSGCPFNGTRFDDAFRRAMKNGFHPIDLGEVYPIGMKTESGLGVGDGIVPSFSFESWKARVLACLTSFPERLERKVYSELGILEYLRENIFELGFLRFPFRKFFSSVIKRDGFLFSFPSSLSKRKGFIVDPPSQFQNVVHFGCLRLGRI